MVCLNLRAQISRARIAACLLLAVAAVTFARQESNLMALKNSSRVDQQQQRFNWLEPLNRWFQEPGEQFARLARAVANLKLEPQSKLAAFIYDDYYIKNLLDVRYPYLKFANGSYAGVRDYFNFDEVFWPSEAHLAGVNVEQALYEEMRAFETTASQASLDTWHYSDQDQLERSGGPRANPAECRRSLELLRGELARAAADPDQLFAPGPKNIDFLRWIDAWARPPSETYLGNSFWVGSYRGCRGARVDGRSLLDAAQAGDSQPSVITFNYCWAKLTPRDWPKNDAMRPRMSVRVGVCLPDSCDTLEARKHFATILEIMHFNFSPMHKRRFSRLIDIYCLPNEQPVENDTLAKVPKRAIEPSFALAPARQIIFARNSLLQLIDLIGFSRLSRSAQVFLALLSAWLSLIAFASLWWSGQQAGGQSRPGGSQFGWLRALSFQENYRVFSNNDEPPAGSRLDLRALGLPKLLAALMVVFGHSFVQSYYSFHSTHLLILESRKYTYHLFAWLWKSVEMFYVISGILTSYSILNKFARTNQMHLLVRPRMYLLLNFIRYLRVAPLFMFIWAFVKTTYLDFSEGPYWDYGTNEYTFMGRCQRISWWRALIWPIILDFKGKTGDPYQHECMSVSWYVVTDLKMFLAVPVYIYLIYFYRKLRWPILFGTLAFSTIWKLAHTHLQQLIYMRQIFSYGEMHAIHILISFLDSSYYSPIDRFQAVALGLSAGFYLYKFKMNRIKRWPWWMRGRAIWALMAWLAYDSVRRILDELQYRETGQIPSDAYIRGWLVLKPRLDAIIITILTLRLCTDWAPNVMRHATVFYKLSKLSYCVYVIHMLPVLYGVNSHERARPDTVPLQLLMLAIYAIAISFLIAFPMFLFVESPLTLLVDHFVMGRLFGGKFGGQRVANVAPVAGKPGPPANETDQGLQARGQAAGEDINLHAQAGRAKQEKRLAGGEARKRRNN